MTLTLESKSFKNNESIPKKFGYKHGNVSPHLKINDIPENTKSLVLIMDDPDAIAAVGKIWVHWTVWNIDPKNIEFAENSVPPNCIEGKTDFGELGYGGPAPPDKEHTYIFKLYALDTKLEINENSTKTNIEDAIKNYIIEETILKGKYSP